MSALKTGLCNEVAMLLATVMLLQPVQVLAQEVIYLEPSLSVFQGYDDNLFYTFDNEEADRISRVTPSLEVGHESERFNWLGRYRFDAEKYDNNPDLDSWLVRRFADASVDYRPDPRLSLSATANYTRTMTPMDLSLDTGGGIQGLLIGRTSAERQVVHPVLAYRFTEAGTGSLSHTLTRDRLAGGIGSDIQMSEVGFSNILSSVNTLDIGYIYRKYSFDNLLDSGNPTVNTAQRDLRQQESHVPWVGLSHDFSARSNFVVRAGPRIYEDSVEPYALVTLTRTNESGEMALSYENNESTLLGELGKVDTQTFSASLEHRFGEKFDFRLIPAYAEVTQEAFEVKIYRLGLNARYALNSLVSFTISCDHNYQRVEFIGGDVNTVSRNVVMVGITIMLPGRNRPRQTFASAR